jgi:hypothetical protein
MIQVLGDIYKRDFPTLTGGYAHEIMWISYTKYGINRTMIGNHCNKNECQYDGRDYNVRKTLSVDDPWTD